MIGVATLMKCCSVGGAGILAINLSKNSFKFILIFNLLTHKNIENHAPTALIWLEFEPFFVPKKREAYFQNWIF